MLHSVQCNKSVESIQPAWFPIPSLHLHENKLNDFLLSAIHFHRSWYVPALYNAPCCGGGNNSDSLSQENGFSISLAIRAPRLAASLKSQQKNIKLFLQSKLLFSGLLKYPLSSKQRHSNMQILCI